MKKNIALGILGGTGFGAGELMRILVNHPLIELVQVTSTSQVGGKISDAHQHLLGFYNDLTFSCDIDPKLYNSYEHKVLVASLPHGTSSKTISKLLENSEFSDFKILDLSGDLRIKSEDVHMKFYPEAPFDEKLRAQFVYGLPEINKEKIANSKYISNPGCLSSSCALAVLPLTDSNFSGNIIFDAKTGTSGAGKSLQEPLHHPNRHQNLNAYKVLEHRHEPEIRQILGDVHGTRIRTSFVPHLLPTSRGILATAYLRLQSAQDTKTLLNLYQKFYASSPFIRIRSGSPEFQNVIGTNFCDISVFARGEEVVAIAALDNLMKGMVGQAVQNINIMTGIPETTGLWYPGFGPL